MDIESLDQVTPGKVLDIVVDDGAGYRFKVLRVGTQCMLPDYRHVITGRGRGPCKGSYIELAARHDGSIRITTYTKQ